MVNGHGKSDRSIAPMKPSNDAGQPAEERVEEGDLAEGNSNEGNAFRTQSRGDARSALERVRRAARKDRKQRFTALFHHVYTSTDSATRTWLSSGMRVQVSTVRRGSTTGRHWRATLQTSPNG
jgi:hypothetical protein